MFANHLRLKNSISFHEKPYVSFSVSKLIFTQLKIRASVIYVLRFTFSSQKKKVLSSGQIAEAELYMSKYNAM